MSFYFLPSCRALALVMTAALVAGPALAKKDDDDGHGKGKHEQKQEKHENKQAEKSRNKDDKKWAKEEKKHAKHHDREDVKVGAYFNDEHRRAVRTYYTQTYSEGRNCPPGLAKKNNGCMPPGQARKWNVGQPLPQEVRYYAVPQPVLVYLPVAPVGYRYVRVGNDILLLSPQSTIIIDVIAGLLG